MNKSIVNRLWILLLLAMCFTKLSASQTTVAHWEFTTGYDVTKSGKTATYTPNTLGWSKIANTYWKTTQPYFYISISNDSVIALKAHSASSSATRSEIRISLVEIPRM